MQQLQFLDDIVLLSSVFTSCYGCFIGNYGQRNSNLVDNPNPPGIELYYHVHIAFSFTLKSLKYRVSLFCNLGVDWTGSLFRVTIESVIIDNGLWSFT